MHDGLGKEVVEQPVIRAFGSGLVDFEQRFRFGAADWLMLHRSRRQDAGAPGGIMGIQSARKMNPSLRGGTFAGDHAVADDGKGLCRGVVAGNRGLDRERVGGNGSGGGHWYSSVFLVLVPAFPCGRKRLVNEAIAEPRNL